MRSQRIRQQLFYGVFSPLADARPFKDGTVTASDGDHAGEILDWDQFSELMTRFALNQLAEHPEDHTTACLAWIVAGKLDGTLEANDWKPNDAGNPCSTAAEQMKDCVSGDSDYQQAGFVDDKVRWNVVSLAYFQCRLSVIGTDITDRYNQTLAKFEQTKARINGVLQQEGHAPLFDAGPPENREG